MHRRDRERIEKLYAIPVKADVDGTIGEVTKPERAREQSQHQENQTMLTML